MCSVGRSLRAKRYESMGGKPGLVGGGERLRGGALHMILHVDGLGKGAGCVWGGRGCCKGAAQWTQRETISRCRSGIARLSKHDILSYRDNEKSSSTKVKGWGVWGGVGLFILTNGVCARSGNPDSGRRPLRFHKGERRIHDLAYASLQNWVGSHTVGV